MVQVGVVEAWQMVSEPKQGEENINGDREGEGEDYQVMLGKLDSSM